MAGKRSVTLTNPEKAIQIYLIELLDFRQLYFPDLFNIYKHLYRC